MTQYKYLAKNIGILAISQFGVKLLSFFLVPLYTSILTTEEYGIYDLFSTTILLLIPFVTLNILEATLRFSLDKESDNSQVFSISILYLLKGTIIVTVFLFLNHIFKIIGVIDKYAFYFWALFFLTTLTNILTSFVRGIEHITDLAISGGICSIVLILLNIIFLIPMHLGLKGYFLANCLGFGSQCIYLIIRIQIWKYFKVEIKNYKLQKAMLAYCKPLIANSVAWWINNASDRYIVTWICGIAENGIYSVSYKIPSILNIFQQIFSQAWTISAVKDFDPEDKDGFFSKMYNLYNFGMTIICSFLIIIARILAQFLYAKEFFLAWRYTPFLLIAIVFGSLSGYIGGIFSAIKNSKIFAQSTVIGAIVNIILNIVLVKVVGAMGAAFATAISYWIVWAIRRKHMKKYLNIELNLIRDYSAYFILIVQTVTLLVLWKNVILLYLTQIILFLINILLFYPQVKFLRGKLLCKCKK